MAAVGDQIEVSSKAGPRSGVVRAEHGPMLMVRWSTGEETSLVPGPGVLSKFEAETITLSAAVAF